MELIVVVCVGLGAEGMVKSAWHSSSRSSVSSLSTPHQPPPGSELSRHQLPWMNAKPISPLSGCTGSAPSFSCSRLLHRVMLPLQFSSVSLSWCRCTPIYPYPASHSDPFLPGCLSQYSSQG